MRTSSEFQTGSLVLLAATVVFGALATALIYPMLSGGVVTSFSAAPSDEFTTPPDYAEFYPAEPEPVRKRLDSLNAMSGHPVFIQSVAKQQPHGHAAIQPQLHDAAQERYVSAVSAEKQAPPEPAFHQEPQQEPDRQAEPIPVTEIASSAAASHTVAQPTHVPMPQAMTAGSVYAPVTVNLDGSLFAGQIQGLEHRLEAMLEQKVSEIRPQPKKVARSDRRKISADNGHHDPLPDESLNQIADGLQQLTASLKELEKQTESSLTELSRQTAQKEATARFQMEEWQRLLDYRIKSAELAARTVVAVNSPLATTDVPTQHFDTPTTKSASSITEPHQATPERDAPRNPIPSEHENAGQPMPFPVDTDTGPDRKAEEAQPSELKRVTVEQPTLDEVPVPMPVLRYYEHSSPTQAEDISIVMPPVESSGETFELPPVELANPEIREFVPHIEPESPKAQPLPEIKVPQANLRSVPDEQILNSAQDAITPAVAFEHVYRFKMADIEDGGGVVPAEGTCPHCGKLHHGNCDHRNNQKVKQTSGIVPSKQSAAPEKKLTQQNRPPTRVLPNLKIPSLTVKDEEPGILHRIGSSLRHFGQKTVE